MKPTAVQRDVLRVLNFSLGWMSPPGGNTLSSRAIAIPQGQWRLVQSRTREALVEHGWIWRDPVHGEYYITTEGCEALDG